MIDSRDSERINELYNNVVLSILGIGGNDLKIRNSNFLNSVYSAFKSTLISRVGEEGYKKFANNYSILGLTDDEIFDQFDSRIDTDLTRVNGVKKVIINDLEIAKGVVVSLRTNSKDSKMNVYEKNALLSNSVAKRIRSLFYSMDNSYKTDLLIYYTANYITDDKGNKKRKFLSPDVYNHLVFKYKLDEHTAVNDLDVISRLLYIESRVRSALRIIQDIQDKSVKIFYAVNLDK